MQHRRRLPLPLLLALLLLIAPLSGRAQAPGTPPLRIIGGPGPGCIQGAVAMPDTGPGFRTIRMSRSAFWGAPSTIAAIGLLAREAAQAGLGDLYVNDIGKPRGGPFPGLHLSHMTGLDADIWLDVRPKPPMDPAQREAVEVASLVTEDGRGVEPSLWSPGIITLIRLATGLPGADRVLVNPAIKRALCAQVTGDRAWLGRVRPWYGHAAHMHIHFRCPPGQAECHDQAPVPPGEGCDASLDWWFEPHTGEPPAPPRAPRLPAACAAILRR